MIKVKEELGKCDFILHIETLFYLWLMTLHFSFLSFNCHHFSESIIYKKLKHCLLKLTLSSGKVCLSAQEFQSFIPKVVWHCHDFWTICLVADKVELSFIRLHGWKLTSDLNIRRCVSLICQLAELGPDCKAVYRPRRDSIQDKPMSFPACICVKGDWWCIFLPTKTIAPYS